jgi:hypothetical protein
MLPKITLIPVCDLKKVPFIRRIHSLEVMIL